MTLDIASARPMPPVDMAPGSFAPCFVTAGWMQAVFVSPDGPLFNEEHAHLESANIGVLWTNCRYEKKGKFIAGQAEIPKATGTWADQRKVYQLEQWFGREEFPDFIITLSAPYCQQASDIEFCALVEHELLHCGHEHDEFGAPRFTQEGGPKFYIRPHDIEEFTTVVARYGVIGEDMAKFVEAANKGSRVSKAGMARACGSCVVRAA